MLARTLSAAVLGVDAYLVDVETDLAAGLPSFTTVGLPLGAVKEGRERVAAALQNSGFSFPLGRITANLAPADVPKSGSAFDLPVAVGLLSASGQVALDTAGVALVGELGLGGEVRPIRGALSISLAARAAGLSGLVVPAANVAEAAVVDGLRVHGASTLREVVGHLSGQAPLPAAEVDLAALFAARAADVADLGEVKGQAHAKRALEVAAAGGHNILMEGPPGSGKTMLARRLPTLLPPLTLAEALETSKVHSVAGTLPPGVPLLIARPFRAPHHTVSDAGLVGGGSWPRPGEVSLAHHGVLFLDELPEFRSNALEVLRQPLEDGVVSLGRAAVTLSFPARCTLAAAMNPCPCGWFGDATRPCLCAPPARRRYRAKVSGPLLDRIDLVIEVPSVRTHELSGERSGESSEMVRERVKRARIVQAERLAARGLYTNSQMQPRDVRGACRLTAAADALLRTAIGRLTLSARAYHRVLKVARTIADLAGAASIEPAHLSEAIQYRVRDRQEAGPPAA